jgi:hypothetical protein
MVTYKGLKYSAETTVAQRDPVLRTRTLATVTNTTSSIVELNDLAHCDVWLRVYRDAARKTRPAWDLSKFGGCILEAPEVELAPRGSFTFERDLIADEVLGDSLPEQRYYLTAVFKVGAREIEVAAGDIELRHATSQPRQ